MGLPQIQSETSSQTGSSGAEMLRSSPDDFGRIGAEEVGSVAQGLDTTTRALGRVMRANMYAEKRVKEIQDSTWVANTAFSTTKALNEWQAAEVNNKSPDFAQNYDKLATSQIQEALKGAPSPEAADALHAHMTDYLTHTYNQALYVGVNNTVTKATTDTDNQISDLMDSYRSRLKTPGANPVGEMLAGVSLLRHTVDTNFGGILPDRQRKLQQTITEQTASGVMNDNPDLAHTIVNSHKNLDEDVRNRLNREIDSSQRVQLSLVADSFRNTVNDNLTNLSNNRPGTQTIPDKQFTTMLPKGEAQEALSHYHDQVGTIQKVQSFKDNFDGLAPQYQRQEIDRLNKGINGAHDEQTFSQILKHYYDNGRLMADDRVAWMQQTNPKVRSLQQTASESSESNRVQSVNEYHSAILQYQGSAPTGTNPDEAKRYLDLPFNDRHLLTATESEQYANTVNKSSPQEAVGAIKKIMDQYPDPTHQAMVFNDLATMGKNPLSQENQLLWQNKDNPDAALMTGATRGGGDVKKLLDEKVVKEMGSGILTNPTWQKFQHALIGGNLDRVKEIEGYHSGILQFAQGLAVGGMKPDAAVNKAVESSLSTMGFTTVNGQSLVVLRDRGVGQPQRTEGEIQDLGRKLTMSLGAIDPREIDQKVFRGLAAYGPDETHVARLQALRDQVSQRGMFQVTADGQGAVLHYKDDTGFPIELRDKQNRPFVIHFDDLPNMTHQSKETITLPEGGQIDLEHTVKDQPQKSYDLTSKYLTKSAPGTTAAAWDKWTGGLTSYLNPTMTRSNFPITPDYVKHELPDTHASFMPNTIGNPRANEAFRNQLLKIKIK